MSAATATELAQQIRVRFDEGEMSEFFDNFAPFCSREIDACLGLESEEDYSSEFSSNSTNRSAA